MSRKFKVSINGDFWSVVLHSESEFDLKYKNAEAITLTDKRQLHFKDSGINILTIRHEVYHAYFDYLCLGSVGPLDVNTFEEIQAEFVSYNIDKIRATSNLIFKNLKKGKK